MQVEPRMTVDNAEFKKTTDAQRFELGCEVSVVVDGCATKYKYVKAHAALTANQPYVIVPTKDGVTTAAPATSAVLQYVGIPQVAIAKDAYGWLCIQGKCDAKGGDAITAGNCLEVLNAGTALSTDGASRSANSIAVAAATTSAAGVLLVNMIGDRVAIAAS